MSGAETIVPEHLQQLAARLDAAVGPELDAARAAFTEAEVDGAAFSTAGLAMQVVYPGSREWAIRDAESKRRELAAVVDKLDVTARLWAGAEQSNTVRV